MVKEEDVISYISFVLNRYNKDKQLLDNLGCKELLNSLIIYNELEDYIKDIKYLSLKANVNMSYSYFDKTINISNDFIKGIKRSSKNMLKQFKINDEIVSTNLDILHALLHEVMHAKQYKIINETSNNTIKTVLTKSLAVSSYEESDNKEDALKFAEASNNMSIYSIMPSELNAEIEAIKQTKEIINHMNIKEKYKYLNFYDVNIKLLQLHSYDIKIFKVISPLDKFIKIRRKYIKEDININKKDIYNLPLEERLSYGFNIHKYEYTRLNNELNQLLKDMLNTSQIIS